MVVCVCLCLCVCTHNVCLCNCADAVDPGLQCRCPACSIEGAEWHAYTDSAPVQISRVLQWVHNPLCRTAMCSSTVICA